MLVLLILLPQVFAADYPKDTNYVIKRTDSCPDVGYYFRRELAPNSVDPGPCFLCFCQKDGTAVCWQRDVRKCDAERFHYHHVGRRDARVRRSPAGLSDIFFRDATRDFFDKKLPQQCDPNEGSYSEGCPPVDWCIGCTVCDCDPNGHWNCHILSFCPDKKEKKVTKKRRNSLRRHSLKKAPKMNNTITNNTVNVKPGKKLIKKSVPNNNKNTTRRPRPNLRNNKMISRKNKTSPKPLIIKRNIATHKSVAKGKYSVKTNPTVKGKATKITNSSNKTNNLAHQVVKQVITAVQKIMKNEMKKIQSNVKVPKKPLVVNGSKTTNGKNGNNNKTTHNAKSKPRNAPPVKRSNTRSTNKATTKYQTTQAKRIARNKREVVTIDSTTPTYNLGNVSEVTANGSITPTITTNESVTSASYIVPSTTRNYYEYLLNENHDSKLENNVNKENKTDVVYHPNTLKEAKESTSNKEIAMTFAEAHPDINDLKFNKWYQVKLFEDKQVLLNINKTRNNKDKDSKNETVDVKTLGKRKKVHRKDIRRILVSEKYKLKKIVPTSNQKSVTEYQIKSNDTVRIQVINDKVNSIQNIFHKLIHDVTKNKTTDIKRDSKAFSVIKYLRKFLTSIFDKSKHYKYGLKNDKGIGKIKDHHIIQTICESIGHCKITVKNKKILKYKLNEINKETAKILGSLKIIKGLLHLIEFHDIKTDQKSNNSFVNDIQKLNIILRGSYLGNNSAQLTETQLTQIEYIQKNTQVFVKSVSRFAKNVHEIIGILTKPSKDDVRRNSLKYIKGNGKKKTSTDPLRNLKKLFLQYNVIQNTFINKMYEHLSKYETKLKNKNTTGALNLEKKILNNNEAIASYSDNIIKNLRKLKDLALRLDSNKRSKRQVTRDDATEYLLMMMEYLLKKNYPLDAAPVNDGIDLLLDAIKNAPDIKPIKKKVLNESSPVIMIVTKSTVPLNLTDFQDDSISDSYKNSKEDHVKTKLDSTAIEAEEHFDEVEKDIYNRKADFNTNNVYYRKVEDSSTTPIEGPIELVTQSSKYDLENVVTNSHNKMENDGGDDRKFEVFTADMDDDVILPDISTTTDETELKPSSTTEIIEITTDASKYTNKKYKKGNYFIVDSEDSNDSLDKRSKLDWIEKKYDKEGDAYKENSTIVPQITTSKSIIATVKRAKLSLFNNADISSLTQEVSSEIKRHKSKISAEEVMFKKQMDLLNSLDYGTERSDFEDSDKEGANVGDGYASYFV